MYRKRPQANILVYYRFSVVDFSSYIVHFWTLKLSYYEVTPISYKGCISYEPIMSTKVRKVSVCVVFAIAFISLTLVASPSFAALHHHHHAYHSTAIIGPPHIGSVRCVYGCPIGNNILGVVVHQLINYFLWSYPWYRWYCYATGLEGISKWKFENVMRFQLPFPWMNVDPFFVWSQLMRYVATCGMETVNSRRTVEPLL